MENKKLYCDLHTHSIRSDAELTRAEVIEEAKKNNIGVLSITDHNIEFDDMDELQAKHPDIKLINGSEVSTCYIVPDTGEEREIHVVALDFENTEHFINVLKHNRFDSEQYVNSIIQKLREAGLEVNFTYDDLRYELNQEFIGRMAIARKLVSLGLVGDVYEAFDEFFGDFGQRKAYVRPDISKYIPLDIAIIEIKNAGGIPVLCHPYSYYLSEDQVVRLIQDFKKFGGLAMETLYSQYTSEQQEQLKAYANEYGLLQSAGSDFHGRGKKGSLNHRFPIGIYFELESQKKQLLAEATEKDDETQDKYNEESVNFFETYISDEFSRLFRSGEEPFDSPYFLSKTIAELSLSEKIIYYIKRVHYKLLSENGSVCKCGTGMRERTERFIKIMDEKLTSEELLFITAIFGLEEPPLAFNEAVKRYSISNLRCREIENLLYRASVQTSGLWVKNPLNSFLED